MNPRTIVPLVAGLCIGGLALKLGWNSLKQAQGSPAPTVSVWAAREDIPRGTTIDEAMLQTIAFPAKGVPASAIREKDKDQIVGRVPRVTAPGGLPVLDSMLLPPGARAGIFVKEGFRAVAVKVDESSSVDYHIEPGSHVDVVGFFTDPRGKRRETIARTLLENVEVAAVGQRISADEDDKSKSKSGSSTSAKPARAVTLFVKPQDVPALLWAEQRGKLKLSMRGVEDVASVGTAVTAVEESILGPNAEEQAEKERQAQEQKSTNSFLSRFLASATPKPTPAAVRPNVKAAADPLAAPAAPKLAWTMRVIHGQGVSEFGWFKMDSIDRVELRSDGRRRGRADPADFFAHPTAGPPAAGAHAPAQPHQAAPSSPAVNNPLMQSEPETSDDPQPEPEELHG
ncbi:MAG: Flp pilus assembly protein CpaB [Phycisphaerae bacterium]